LSIRVVSLRRRGSIRAGQVPRRIRDWEPAVVYDRTGGRDARGIAASVHGTSDGGAGRHSNAWGPDCGVWDVDRYN